ncbi:MAG: hypothetical protein FWG30_08690 [Eubacteriaceae bacterium]|nr:hypothetical protein [Eubacteriaceae bacterium]
MVAIYSIAHFLVDLACAYLMFRFFIGTPNAGMLTFAYNYCAFALQMPLGAFADKLNRNWMVAAVGIIIVGASCFLAAMPFAAVILAGIGNACFHVGGGIDVLNVSKDQMKALGVFVSPGAFGIYLGTMLGKTATIAPALLPLILFLPVIALILLQKAQSGLTQNAAFSLQPVRNRNSIVPLACLFAVVCLRSYIGLAVSFPWKAEAKFGALLICAVVAGKAAGGFAADKAGAAKVSMASLAIASVLFLAPQVPTAGIISMLAFNMTMPITLWSAAKIMPGAKGFAFGTLSFGLFIGFLPVYFFGGQGYPPIFFTAFGGLSLALLIYGLKGSKI